MKHNLPELWRAHFPWPEGDTHKYKRGHAVVIGGGREMTGAARLAAYAALKTAAGIVTILAPDDALEIYAKAVQAILVRSCNDEEYLRDFMAQKNVHASLIGPGAGVSKRTRYFTVTLLAAQKPMVIDADAISVFEDNPEELFSAIKKNMSPVILTPHEGEFVRIFPDLAGVSKESAAKEAAVRSSAIIVFKGEKTMIAAPDGKCLVNTNAPPTLATAGSGDVLAGIVVGLLAAKMSAFDAACAGTYLHGQAANLFGLGLTAEDLLHTLPKALKELRESA